MENSDIIRNQSTNPYNKDDRWKIKLKFTFVQF